MVHGNLETDMGLTANISLAVFFTALILAGLGRGLYTGATFQDMMLQIRPFLLVFAVSGVTLMLGIWIVLWHAYRLTGEILSPATPETYPEPA